jgi:hypothetical protein
MTMDLMLMTWTVRRFTLMMQLQTWLTITRVMLLVRTMMHILKSMILMRLRTMRTQL